jgi:hypothetical protein
VPRVLVGLALTATVLAAGGKPYEDAFWDIRYGAPGLQPLMAAKTGERIYAGKCDGGVRLTIEVLEFPTPMEASAVRATAKETWKKAGRKIEGLQEGDSPYPWVLFAEPRLEVFVAQHGYAWETRGYHCFVIHAEVFERTDRSADAIRAALKGLRVGPRDECAILAARVALERGIEPTDPIALYLAGVDYATGRRFRRTHPPLARRLLERARAHLKPDTLETDDLWQLYETGGNSWMAEPGRDPAKAMEWFVEAEKAANKLEERREERAAGSAYNLACAASLSGKLDEAFAALHRAYRDVKPVTDDHVSNDKDLENLRRDKRWEVFWHSKVKN